MRKYDFSSRLSRRSSSSQKWDVKEGELPLTIADMDFKAAPEIQDALERRVREGVFGYVQPNEEWKESIQGFYRRRHGYDIDKDWIVFSTGVIPTLSSSVRALTEVGDKVIVTPPVYNIFYHSITNNRRIILPVPLLSKEKGSGLDFTGLEKAFKDPKAKLMLLCNPENPTGKVYSKEDLAHLGELARENGVVILSDEIHGELTRPGISYNSYLFASEENRKNSLIALSPTKAYNLAGIKTSEMISADPVIRDKVASQLNIDECEEPNDFAIPAAIAAYGKGEDWLDSLRAVIDENEDVVISFLEENKMPLTLSKAEATYLLWISTLPLTEDGDRLASFLREKTGLMLTPGSLYGEEGKPFLRMNVAVPKEELLDGLARLKEGIRQFLEEQGK